MRLFACLLAACSIAVTASAADANLLLLGAGHRAQSQPAAAFTFVLDSFPASPGAWTAAYSLRALRSAYAGSAIQLQRSSDNTTQDIGFNGGNPDTSGPASFCATATLAAGTTSSTRVAYPTGSVIHVFNEGPSAVSYASGNSSVTVTASPSSTVLNFRQGLNITVGANTNLAAVVGTGYGVNGGTGSATLFLTNCGTSKIYDQSGNSNDLAQTTEADQLGYAPSAQGSLPLLFGCLVGCGLHAPDSASYKTTTVETFTVMTLGEDITTGAFFYFGIGYPNTTSSDASDFRWGLVNDAGADILTNDINSLNVSNAEGFGGVWRGQNLTQYDYSNNGITRWNGGTQFMNTGSATLTYPTAVGLYVMGDAAGHGTPGTFAEALVASGTQTSRNSVSSNQVAYWGITQGAAESAALANPLGDGFNWNRIQLGGFAPQPPGVGAVTVNGTPFFSESSWNDYTQWQCANCLSTGGRLGDTWRFQLSGVSDQWDGTNRSELDGASGSAEYPNGTTFWLAYAIYVDPGTPYTSNWNINGQMHVVGNSPLCCIFEIMSNSASVADNWFIYTNNATTGVSSSTTNGGPITRGRWYHFVYQVLASTSGTADIFNVWLDKTTEGTMVQIASNSGASLFGGNGPSTQDYWKYGLYRDTESNLPTFAVRYGNMQICSAGADCTAKYGVSDLSALETTPLPDPSH